MLLKFELHKNFKTFLPKRHKALRGHIVILRALAPLGGSNYKARKDAQRFADERNASQRCLIEIQMPEPKKLKSKMI